MGAMGAELILPHDASSWAILYYVSEWVIRIAMLIIVPFRRTPDAARGWLMLVLFLPWLALLVYWLIGRPTFPRWRRERFLRLPHVLQITAEQMSRMMNAENVDLPPRVLRA